MLGFYETQQLAHRLSLFDHPVADIGPVKAADELPGRTQIQPLDHVLPGQRIGRGGQSHPGHLGELLMQERQSPVFGPKVMPPLADAMRLVDGKQAKQALLIQRAQLPQHARGVEPLRRHVEQGQLGALQPGLHLLGLLKAQAGIEKGRRHARLQQSAHLIVHQRNQGRDHHRNPQAGALAGNGRYLIAQRLAAAGRHEHQGVAAGDHMLDDVLLRAAKTVVTEDLAEDLQRLVGHHWPWPRQTLTVAPRASPQIASPNGSSV